MLHKRLTELEEWLRVCYYRRGENQLPTVLRVNNARSTTSIVKTRVEQLINANTTDFEIDKVPNESWSYERTISISVSSTHMACQLK